MYFMYRFKVLFIFFLTYMFFSKFTYMLASENVKVQLIPQLSNYTSNTQKIDIGILFQIKEKWHIYWKNPGSIGKSTEVNFIGNDNFIVNTPITWPAPQKKKDGNISTYVYSEQVFLLTFIDVKKYGQTLQIEAWIEWLECSNVCINKKEKVSTKILYNNLTSIVNTQYKDLLSQNKSLYPITLKHNNIKAIIQEDYLNIDLSLQNINNIKDVFFFPYDTNIINDDSEQKYISEQNILKIPISKNLNVDNNRYLNGILKIISNDVQIVEVKSLLIIDKNNLYYYLLLLFIIGVVIIKVKYNKN